MEDRKVVVIPLRGQEKYTRLLSGAPQTQGMRSGLVHLQPGEEIGAHSTEGKEEALVLLAGKAEIFCPSLQLNGKACAKEGPLTIEAPALVYIPSMTTHNVKNIGDHMLHYVYVVAPVTP